MRVAFLSHNARQRDAIGNQLAEKVRFFQERGAEVRVFVEDARHLHADVQPVCVEVREVVAAGPIWDFLAQADLVFAVYGQDHSLLQFLPRLAGIGPRIAFEYFGVTPPAHALAQQRESLERSQHQRGLAWCADQVLATSSFAARELHQATNFPRANAMVLPLPVDDRFASADRRDKPDGSLRACLGIDGRILLYVGRLAKNKRVPLLIEALARLNATDVHAVIVGDISDVYAEEAARCKTLAEQLGVAHRVHLLGSVDDADLPDVYRSAGVFVMPSVHEGFCVPVVEAMASGVPVLASRSAALPETLGDAGLTFTPDDAMDLARTLERVLNSEPSGLSRRAGPRRIAIVSFRYGRDIVGGAETSLRSMATALHDAGQAVEVFTTCTITESHWRNDLQPGTVTQDGIPVHWFPIDAHDPVAHGETYRAILEADGAVQAELARRYLAQSVHSAALLAALRARADEFDAVIVGPYLFGLTADILAAFPSKTLLAPCFHDEPLARLPLWPNLCRDAGGILYHSPEEREYAQTTLGVNHPNTCEIGAHVPLGKAERSDEARPYVVYCGRYSSHKNVPLLLEWAGRYQTERPGLDFVFMGRGETKLPREPWLRDLGYVDETTKRDVLRNAEALVQLSTHESLSLVVLEAWAEGTPVIVHEDCPVLRGQVGRAQAGVAVTDFASFAAALDELRNQAASWREQGEHGRAYIAAHYACRSDYAQRILRAIERLDIPIVAQMRDAGVARAATSARQRWQQSFTDFIDRILTQPSRPFATRVLIEPLQTTYQTNVGTRTLLATVRLRNAGTHAALPDGPGRTRLRWAIGDASGAMPLPALLTPGRTQVAALPITVPQTAGMYHVRLWMEQDGAAPFDCVEIELRVGSAGEHPALARPANDFLDTVAETLPKTHALQRLPTGYVDVTEGRLAPIKRLVKEKLLHNFKHAYVDVLSRQQSDVNGQVVLMIQQLAECCAVLDHAVRGLHQRLDGLEEKIERLSVQPSESPVASRGLQE